jgi:hypothetical protein
LRVVVAKVAVQTQKVTKRDVLEVYDVVSPTYIIDFDLRHPLILAAGAIAKTTGILPIFRS